MKNNKKVKEKFADEDKVKQGCDYFMKIGHYMINFRAYRNDADSFQAYKKSKFYQDIEKEQQTIEEQNKIIIDE